MIGSLGPVIFKASTSLIRTFDEMQHTGEARFAEHQRIGYKPLIEFIGPGLQKVTYSMYIAVELGLSPAEEVLRLRGLRDAGIYNPLILDGKPIGLFVITSLSEEWNRLDNKGRLLAVSLSVSLTEYVEAVP